MVWVGAALVLAACLGISLMAFLWSSMFLEGILN